MLNTYGIRSVSRETFNMTFDDSLFYEKPLRDGVVTLLRINNAALNVLGYIPGVSSVSGCVRMAIGGVIIGLTLVVGDRYAPRGVIIGRWYDEALNTGMAQVVRGALEAIGPMGWIANATLDIIATPINLGREALFTHRSNVPLPEEAVRPHDDTYYPFPFALLHMA